MAETFVLGLFITGLLICVVRDLSIIYALAFGFIVFFIYGMIKKNSFKTMICVAVNGIKTIKNILIVFLLIGILTAVWRASGTIPAIIYYSTKAIAPQAFILMTFLLCSVVSVLMGTAFGTSATMGVICMTMSNAIGADPFWTGGAILSGVFFGDRCSPMSTSALLTSELTKTDIYKNIKLMVKTSIVPFVITCAVYLVIGIMLPHESVSNEMANLFEANFNLHWITVIPAALIVVLSLFKINVKKTMITSILTGTVICVALQKVEVLPLLKMMVLGFTAEDAALGAMLNGGGIKSMIKVSAIVCLSSSYAGMFEKTGLLINIKKYIGRMMEKITPFGGIAVTSIFTSMISCNQSLAIILTNQLCGDMIEDNYEMANAIENTVVVISPLIPWSIAAAVPLSTVGAPVASIMASFYLYLIPIYNLFIKKMKVKAAA